MLFFTLAGFRWWDGLAQVQLRYYEGIASSRPYSYFVWANLAAFVVCASPVVALVIAGAGAHPGRPGTTRARGGAGLARPGRPWW